MKKLLIRADDIGYSEAVTAGILSALESGLVKSAGLMVNMPFTEKSVELIKDRTDICFGLHVNLVIGPACCQDREAVKDLVDGQGRFIASRIRREEFARGLDSMSYAQVCREIEAQAERYEALMGSIWTFMGWRTIRLFRRCGIWRSAAAFPPLPTAARRFCWKKCCITTFTRAGKRSKRFSQNPAAAFRRESITC